MRYNRLTDLGLTEAQIQDNLMFATRQDRRDDDGCDDAGRTARRGSARRRRTCRSRRASAARDWLYNYLLGFYRDEKSATGWNNIVFPNVAMPHVLWELSGINKLVETEFEDHEKATAAAIAVKGLSAVEPLQGRQVCRAAGRRRTCPAR